MQNMLDFRMCPTRYQFILTVSLLNYLKHEEKKEKQNSENFTRKKGLLKSACKVKYYFSKKLSKAEGRKVLIFIIIFTPLYPLQ